MKIKLFSQILFALIVLSIHNVSHAAPQALSATMEFQPINLINDAGAEVKNATLIFQNKSYSIQFDGLSVGGAKGVQVTLTAEVYDLNNINAFADKYVNELSQDNSDVASTDSLWIYSKQGVRINLHTNNPELSLASGGESVSVGFGKAP
ncbi:MAG: hypothetical protein WCH01_13695 [Methylococcaceae bacterium]